MRKVKFLQNYKDWHKGQIIKIDHDTANRLMVAGIVTYI